MSAGSHFSDTHFNGIANKFDENIYGSLKGKLRHRVLTQLIHHRLPKEQTLRILDMGGGTGMMAKVCADLGHHVDLVDAAQDALTLAAQKMGSHPNVTLIQSTLADFPKNKQYDVVICHAMLEWLHEPYEAIPTLKQFVKPLGLLSLSVFNKDAALFSNMSYGNFDYVQKGMKVKNQVRLNPKNPISPKALLSSLKGNSFVIEQKTGIRCFSDYVKRTIDNHEFDTLFKLEMEYASQEPYLWLGRYFHVFAKLQ